MKKITFLLALFCMLLSTATAQIRVPSSTLLTVDQLNNATENVYLAIKCISGTNSYWFCGNKSVQSTTDQEIIFVWEPSGDGQSHYLKKFAPTNAQGDGYLQANGNGANLTIGAKSSAQKFKAVAATLPGGDDNPVEGTNTNAGYIVRFAEAAGTAYWLNVQTPTGRPKYNTGPGLYTMFNIYQADETNVFNVTINYKVGAKNYLSTTIAVVDGTTLNASHFNHLSAAKDYVTVSDWDKKDAVTEECTVNVSCTVSNDCPLVFSESFENAVWQMVNIHSNESNYVWSVNLDGEGQPTINVINKGGENSYKSSVAPQDQELWAFVGDITGFKIYNKAAGEDYVMSKPTDGDNAVSWTDPANGTVYTAHRTTTNISNGACILPKGHTYYINHRVTNIQGWTDRDGGSTVKSFAPDAFLLAYNDELPPVGALGTSSYFRNVANANNYFATLATLNENHYNVEAAHTLSTILTAAAGAELLPNDITEYSYYRLYNYKHKAFVTSGHNDENEDALQGIDKTAAISTAGTIVKFVQDGGNYKLYTQGLGFGNVATNTQVTLDNESHSFAITNEDNLYAFRDVNSSDNTHNYLHYQADGKIVGWDNGETTTASKWYLVPANELVLELNPEGDHTYASTFLPYDFTIDNESGVRAYKVTHTEGEVAKTMEVADIAAEQGVILVGATAEKTSVRLYIGTATSNFGDNILSGTTTRLPITEEDKPTLFVLGNGTHGVGFYNPNSTTLKENRAFLYAEDVIGEATNGLRLEFGGETTGITATETLNNANAPIFDLSGRRVANPVKGIYVKDGKKIYVK